MSLIPFILDLADELHDLNRSLAVSGMDVDDFGFGIYPQELQYQPQPLQQPPQQAQSLLRRPRTVASQLYWLPSIKQRPHPYGGRNKACCAKSAASLANTVIHTTREAATPNGAGGQADTASAAEAATATAKSAFSVVNKHGFQVSMNVKQFAPSELTVKTIDNCIVVEGQHEDKEDGHGVISRHFIRKYMLPKGYDPAEVLSTLSSDGILTVKAPPPPVTKAPEPLERIVDIQQTGPAAHLAAKDATSREQAKTATETVATAATAATDSQQPPQELQQQQQQQPQQPEVNEHNVAAVNNNNNNNNEMHSSRAVAEPTAGASAQDVQTAEETPVLVASNNIAVVAAAAAAANDANMTAVAANDDANANTSCSASTSSKIANNTTNNVATVAATAAAVSKETNGGIDDIPVIVSALPACSDVVVVMEIETAASHEPTDTSDALLLPAAGSVDGVAAAAVELQAADGADGVGGAMEVDESAAVTVIAVEQLVVAAAPVAPAPMTADLVAAADAAILLAKAQNHGAVAANENGNNVAAAVNEELDN